MESIPAYLQDVLDEATNYYESDENLTRVDAAHEIAHQNWLLVGLDRGDHDTLNVLRDIRNIHTLCADEFETYRQYQESEYADSILEAVALRSLEELINVHLHENQSFNSKTTDSAAAAK